MPQEASKISVPDTTTAAEEVAAESSNQNANHQSEDESGDEATETVEGGEGATEKKKSRKRKIKDAISGKGKAPEVTDLNAPAAGQLGKDQMSMLLDANPALKNQLMSKANNRAELEQMIKKLNPDMTDELLAYSTAKMKEYGIVDSGDTLKDGIGAMSDARVAGFFDKMVRAGVVRPDIDYRKAYTLRFANKAVGLGPRPKN